MGSWAFAFLVPFQFAEWTPVPMGRWALPRIEAITAGLSFTSENSAGGFVYFLPTTERLTGDAWRASWKWSVNQFPKAKPAPPFRRREDDYPLRVGFLFSSGKDSLSLPKAFRRELSKRKETLSSVLLYGATRAEEGNPETCASSPFDSNIHYCTRHARENLASLEVTPAKDWAAATKETLIGLWLFADSDDSESASQAQITELTLHRQ